MVPAKPDKAFLSKIKTKMTERKRKLAERPIGDGGGTHMVLHTGDSQHGPFSRVNYVCPDAQNLGGESFVWKAASILEHEDVPELRRR